MFDQAIIDEGLKLTALGVGTAFALLLFLSLSIWIAGKFLGPKDAQDAPDEGSSEQRNKALAASIAVATLLEIHENSAALPKPAQQ